MVLSNKPTSMMDLFLISFMNNYGQATCNYFGPSLSDNRGIVLSILNTLASKKPPLRFINHWIKDKGFKDLVRNAWNLDVNVHPMFILVSKLNHLKKILVS